jgi:hypothetical protein
MESVVISPMIDSTNIRVRMLKQAISFHVVGFSLILVSVAVLIIAMLHSRSYFLLRDS